MKKMGFTLAEVLITLGIIGVVAALVMPGLIANYQKKVLTTQITRASNIIQNAARLYMAKEEMSDLYNGNGDNPDEMNPYINDFMKASFNVARDCTSSLSGCFADSYININKDPLDDGRSNWQNCYALVSGESVCIFYFSDSAWGGPSMMGIVQYSLVSPATVVVDTNGKKGPNTLGRDLFVMELDANGTLQTLAQQDVLMPGACMYGGACNPATSMSTTCTEATTLLNVVIGSGLCFDSIISDGWQMKY